MTKPDIIVITGPTATGKTALGVKLAKAINGEIISADSMQVYKHMDIGAAKPTVEERCGVPHHLLDIISPFEDYSVARYVKDASKCVDDIFKRGKIPVLVGGSGFYIDSLIAGRTFSARGESSLRKQLEDEFDKTGGETMLQKLRMVDAESAAKLHSNDKKRIMRALEAFIATGKTISEHDIESKSIPPRYNAVKFALTFSQRKDLYERINRRVDGMMLRGLADEVRSLLYMGVSRNNTSMQAIGYKEISAALLGYYDMISAEEKIKMESRRYAKRQLTWLRRDDKVTWITWEGEPDYDAGTEKIIRCLE